MTRQKLNCHEKALAINLDANKYGTIAEIGAGQEVARWFFKVGGAAGTVAKTISAYDMSVSDEVYGPARPFVSRARLLDMLDYEYQLVVDRHRGPILGARSGILRTDCSGSILLVQTRETYEGPHPAMLMLGGSGGGVLGTWGYPGGMSSHGYAVLSLGYFGVEGLPPEHALIPLEYFKTALDWLSEHPAVDATRIGVLGMSRGGELALLLGATYPQIATVVAQVPSHVVWSGCCGFNGPSGWSLGGEPIQQVLGVVTPEAVARHANGREPQFVHNFLALLDDEAAVARAVIPVERINGPVLLTSRRDDLVWPSTYMADQVVARLRQHGFRHGVTHLAYDNAGHVIAAPPGLPTCGGWGRRWVAHKRATPVRKSSRGRAYWSFWRPICGRHDRRYDPCDRRRRLRHSLCLSL